MDSIIKSHPNYQLEKNSYMTTMVRQKSLKLEHYPLTGSFISSTYGSFVDPSFDFYVGTSIQYELFNKTNKEKVLLSNNDIVKQEHLLNITYSNLKFQVISLLLQYLYSRDYYNHSYESYVAINDYTEKVASRFTKGDLSKSEILYAQSVLLKNEGSVLDSEFVLNESKKIYEDFSKVEIDNELNIEDLELIESLEIEDDWFKSSENLKYRNSILNGRFIEKDFIYKNSSPQIDFSGTLKYPFDSSTSWQLGATITYPIFGIKYDKLKEQELTGTIDSEKIIIENEKKEYLDRLNAIIRRIELLDNKLEIYKRSLNFSQQSYNGVLLESNAGVRTVFDVINAQKTISDNQLLIIDSTHEIYSLKLEFMFLKGDLHE